MHIIFVHVTQMHNVNHIAFEEYANRMLNLDYQRAPTNNIGTVTGYIHMTVPIPVIHRTGDNTITNKHQLNMQKRFEPTLFLTRLKHYTA